MTSTIIISALVGAIIVLSAYYTFKDHKKCRGSCASCPYASGGKCGK